MKTILLFLLLLGSSLNPLRAIAADGGVIPISTEKPRPKIVEVGPDTFVDFQDGRVAGFYQSIGKVVHSEVGLSQIENTCNFQQKLAQCKLLLDLAPMDITVRWVKHPHNEKVGQIVKAKPFSGQGKQDSTPLDDNFGLLFWYNTLKDPTYAAKTQPDQLVCDNFDWTEGMSTSGNQITLDTWASEFMNTTEETGVNENQTNTAVYDVRLKRVDQNTMEFLSFGKEKVFSVLPPHVSTQVASLSFINHKNEACLVSFQANVEKIGRLNTDPNFRTLDPSTLAPLRNKNILRNGIILFYLGDAFDGRFSTEYE